MSTLVPCPVCARHVRTSDASCPFCDSTLPRNLAARAVPPAGRRLDRLAAFTFAATVAVTGCVLTGDETGSNESEIGAIQPMYGMPPEPPIVIDAGPTPDAAADAATPPCDDGAVHAMYGAPPGDSGPPLQPCPVDDGGTVQPMYGMPAPVDAGPLPFDGGGIQPMYGMPAGKDAGSLAPFDGGGVHALYGSPGF